MKMNWIEYKIRIVKTWETIYIKAKQRRMENRQMLLQIICHASFGSRVSNSNIDQAQNTRRPHHIHMVVIV